METRRPRRLFLSGPRRAWRVSNTTVCSIATIIEKKNSRERRAVEKPQTF